MMEKLGNYELAGHLTSQNSGYSVWGFGRKEGRNFFIKQFLSPKYPENDTASSPERLARKKAQCARFEEQKTAIYQAVNENSDGNAVRICEFFRIGSKYYITMRKIESLEWTVEDIARLSERDKRRLCAIIAHSIHGLHQGGVVHADLKHDNVLYMQAQSGAVTAKIIDFDSSFLESDPPEAGEEIVGDLVYFSPEACRSLWGQEVALTCKMDIFALGVLFHQYFSGELPLFDRERFNYPGEAVAQGEPLEIAGNVPKDVGALLQQMLQEDPDLRPTADVAFDRLRIWADLPTPPAAPERVTKELHIPREKPDPVAESTTQGNPFFRPGDL